MLLLAVGGVVAFWMFRGPSQPVITRVELKERQPLRSRTMQLKDIPIEAPEAAALELETEAAAPTPPEREIDASLQEIMAEMVARAEAEKNRSFSIIMEGDPDVAAPALPEGAVPVVRDEKWPESVRRPDITEYRLQTDETLIRVVVDADLAGSLGVTTAAIEQALRAHFRLHDDDPMDPQKLGRVKVRTAGDQYVLLRSIVIMQREP